MSCSIPGRLGGFKSATPIGVAGIFARRFKSSGRKSPLPASYSAAPSPRFPTYQTELQKRKNLTGDVMSLALFESGGKYSMMIPVGLAGILARQRGLELGYLWDRTLALL